MKSFVAFLLAFCLAACSAPGDVEIHQAWVRSTAQNEDAAIYFTLQNNTSADVTFIGASSTLTEVVEIHETRVENDVAKMVMLPSVTIAAGEELVFEPGSFHVTLLDIQQGVIIGEEFGITLHFSDHPDIPIMVLVSDLVPEGHHDH